MNQSELESVKMCKCHVWLITNQNLYPQNSVSQKSTHFFRLVFIHLLVQQGNLIQIICSVCLTEIVLGEESEERKFEKNYPRTIQIFLSSAKFSSAAPRKIWLRFGKFGLYSDNFFQIFFLRSLRPYNFLQNFPNLTIFLF